MFRNEWIEKSFGEKIFEQLCKNVDEYLLTCALHFDYGEDCGWGNDNLLEELIDQISPTMLEREQAFRGSSAKADDHFNCFESVRTSAAFAIGFTMAAKLSGRDPASFRDLLVHRLAYHSSANCDLCAKPGNGEVSLETPEPTSVGADA